jgi:hypothetical protein
MNSITGSNNFTVNGSSIIITGSLIVSGSGTLINIGPAVFSGSVTSTAGFSGSFSGTADSSSYAYTASSATNAFNAISASYAYTASSAINAFTASKAVSSSDADTASFANNFTVLGNLTVFGTQSIEYITSSQLNISDNVITVNVASPGVRFGGLSVFDSGSQSSEATASLFWDSQQNHWIYQRERGSSYDGGMLISGPRNAAGLGNEQGTTSCMLLVGQGGDHLTSSLVYHDSTRTCFYGNSLFVSSSGNTGLGLNNPTNKLEVQSGDIKLNAGASRCTSVFFGITGTNYGRIQYSDMDGSMFITTMGVGSGYDLNFGTKDNIRFNISGNGAACFACELTAKTIGTNDLILSNVNYESANYVDGTRGSWLIQEGAHDLFIINQISCKKYKFNLIEIK